MEVEAAPAPQRPALIILIWTPRWHTNLLFLRKGDLPSRSSNTFADRRITFLIQPRCDVPTLPSCFFPPLCFPPARSASSHSHLLADLGTQGPDSHSVCLSQRKVLFFELHVFFLVPQPGGSVVKSVYYREHWNLPTVTSSHACCLNNVVVLTLLLFFSSWHKQLII